MLRPGLDPVPQSDLTGMEACTYFFRCSCNSCSLQVESNAAQDALMCGNVHWWLLGAGQVHKLYVAGVSAGEGEKGVVTVGTQDTETYAETERTGWKTTLAKPVSSATSQLFVECINLGIVTDWKESRG